ncbi:serine hydrolase, partial [Staphylococcus agnetis]
MLKSQKLFLELLNEETLDVDYEKMKKLVSKEINMKEVKKLETLIQALKVGDNKYKWNDNHKSISVSNNSIKGNFSMRFDNEGLLKNFFIIPETPIISDLNTFEESVKIVNCEYEIQLEDGLNLFKIKSNSMKTPAIASMVKIVVAYCTLKDVNLGNLKLESCFKIKNEDISVLSAGISSQNIGQEFTVQQLLSNMMILSDNTAMDILIKRLGEGKIQKYISEISENINVVISLPLSKKIYSKAWMSENLDNKLIRYNSMTKVVWTKNLDYFIPLDIIRKCLDYLLIQNWLPWDDLNLKNNII